MLERVLTYKIMNKMDMHKILKTWGKNNQELPESHETLKRDIFSKVNFSPISFREKSPTPWLSLGFAVLAIVITINHTIRPAGTITNISLPVAPTSLLMNNTNPEMSATNEVGDATLFSTTTMPGFDRKVSPPISDAREFLQTFYNADISATNVITIIPKVEMAIRGSGGRIDTIKSGDQTGYIAFALPERKFKQFKNEVRNIAGNKFILENISSENMLAQKISIEERQEQSEVYMHVDEEALSFAKSIATVNGSISFHKINFWEMCDLYIPGPLLAWIMAIASLISYIKRKEILESLQD